MKKVIAILVALVFALAAFACYDWAEVGSLLGITEPDKYYGFAKDENGTTEFYSAEEINNFEFTLDKYSSKVYFEKLNDREKVIYKAFLYAVQESYPCVFFDKRATEGNTYSPGDILSILSLSSPLIEQNLHGSSQDCSFNVGMISRLINHETYAGTRYMFDSFNEENLAKKNDAIAAAEKFLAEVGTDYKDKKALAKAIYEKFVKESKYVKYENATDYHDHLYDAIIKHESQCDGFANALSLLYNMAGIDCFEKIYEPGDESEGHTWNCILIENEYYNVDATCDPRTAAEREAFEIFPAGFGFTDSLQAFAHGYADILPASTAGNLFGSQKIDMKSKSAATNKIAEIYKKSGNMFAVTYSDAADKTVISVLQGVCDKLRVGMNYETYTGQSEKLLVIYKDK